MATLFITSEWWQFLDFWLSTYSWFPCHERASAVGLSMAGFHLGNVISFLATPVIMSSIGLAGAFSLFASLGFMWLSLWVNGVTNDPGDSPLISTYELQLIRAGKTDVSSSSGSKFPPLRHLLSKLPTWAIIFANVTNNWVSSIYQQKRFSYLSKFG